MKRKKTGLLLSFAVLLNIQLMAQVRISGFVRDINSDEALIFAHVLEKGSNNYALSDNNGYFSIIANSPVVLEFTYVGYKPLNVTINQEKDTLIDVHLTSDNVLEDVVVKAPKILSPNVSAITGKKLQHLPSIGARPDVFKTLQLFPGIQTQNEGSSLLLVRGGDPGQNLYLIDNVPLIYVNHLGGFMSVFNPDMINNVSVYKGGFPARYGGKLSSIVDIAQREGNTRSLTGSFSIGITDMSFSVEGPVREKSSFIVTGRIAFLGAFSALATHLLPDNYYTLYYGFHDINAKYSWKPNTKNSFHVNFYQGDDKLLYKLKKSELKEGEKAVTSYIWGNWLLSAHWNSIVSNKLHVSNSLSFTRYRLKNTQDLISNTGTDDYKFNSEFLSSLKDVSIFSDWKLDIIRQYSVEFGAHSSYLLNIPNKYYDSNQLYEASYDLLNALQSDIFVENRFKFRGKSHLNIGIRGSGYIAGDFSDFNLEPRVNLDYKINKNQSPNLSYMRVYQYSHLLFTPGSISNNEIWVSSDQFIPPAMADIYAAGWQGRFYDGMFDFELNVYYKRMMSLTSYKDGYSNLLGSTNWHSKVTSDGTGVSKGIEFYLKKNFGKWTGFMGYTLSQSTRKYEAINNGEEFLFDFDRPHCFSTAIKYGLNEKWEMNLAWVFQSGVPYTPAIGRQYTAASGFDAYYHADEYEALIYGSRNSGRLKPYHRLDLSFIYTTETSRGNKAEWAFSVYNVYNRQNPYYYYYNTNNTGEMIPPDLYEQYKPLSLYQISFLPIIPSVSYKIYFNTKQNRNENSEREHRLKKWFFYEN